MHGNEELCWMPATELASAIKRKEISPVEVVEATLRQIDRINPLLNAYCTITADSARQEAKKAEDAVMRGGTLGPLHGVPFSVKDLITTKGVRTTFGSKIFADNVPAEDAPAVERLKKAGGMLIGKTNTPEFGWLAATHNQLFGPTRNPWNLELTSGGSSGGAAAAVAAGMGPLALGSDGGGSIRVPASFCGIVGFKPSYGRIPIYPNSSNWSISHYGPMTRTVKDAALMMNVLAGPDDRDQYSLPPDSTDYVAELNGNIKGLRVAWSANFGYGNVDAEVAEICRKAALTFQNLGCEVEGVNPNWEDPYEIWTTLFNGGFGARVLSLPESARTLLEPGLARIAEDVKHWPASKYVDAWLKRLSFWDSVRKFFSSYDLLLTPTVSVPPFKLGLEHPDDINDRPPWRWSFLSHAFNLTGQPAATVPCGFTEGGLPVGLQIVGQRFADALVLRTAAAFESAQSPGSWRPPLES